MWPINFAKTGPKKRINKKKKEKTDGGGENREDKSAPP